jgi:hypothetical protein
MTPLCAVTVTSRRRRRPSDGALPAVGDAEEARDALGPHLVLSLAAALELDHPVLRRPQAEVAPVLAALQQVPPRPRRHVPAHVHHHACTIGMVQCQCRRPVHHGDILQLAWDAYSSSSS